MGRPANTFARWRGDFGAWVDARFPMSSFWRNHISEYYAPKNFNIWYVFGSLALLVLVNQLVTGIWLAMHYKPDAELAFASVEYIMRDVEWGWLLRYLHSTGASAFFIVVYLHMFRGLMYGSYRKPRELIWVLGMLLFMLLMAEAFMGYVLPWGQMSYWGAQVIVSLLGAIPYFGEGLAMWVRGDFLISDATLNRFFAMHVALLPMLLLGLVVMHLTALHHVGSNNPDGLEIKDDKDEEGKPRDGIPFHPFYTAKDLFAAAMFMMIIAFVVFYAPELGGQFLEDENFAPADPLTTPEHIKPIWYFTPFYAILRAIPLKEPGVLLMGLSIFVLFLVPWLDKHPVRSVRHRGLVSKAALGMFAISFIGLGYIGGVPGGATLTSIGRLLTFLYFAYFAGLPFYHRMERWRPLPERIGTR